MLENRVLFQIGAEPWTLAGACLALGAALVLMAAGLFVLLFRRHGRTRRLAGYEANRAAFGARTRGELPPNLGPALGVDARVRFTIGDLRRARQAGDHLLFWGGPAMMMAWIAGFGLAFFATMLWTRAYVLLLAYLMIVPMLLIIGFMPWAAIHTKLE
jgi:hypothetical protein